jgi:hypothetical protein
MIWFPDWNDLELLNKFGAVPIPKPEGYRVSGVCQPPASTILAETFAVGMLASRSSVL